MSTTTGMADAGIHVTDLFCGDGSGSESSSNLDVPRYKTSYQEDVKDWGEVNKLLRHHGLSSVKVVPLSQVSRSSGKMMCLDADMSQTLRQNISSLLSDCDHRQSLIQDLITSNNQLKEDVNKQTDLVDKYRNKVKDLKVMLESSRNRITELEDDIQVSSFHYDEDGERLRNTKSAIHNRCQQLEQKCHKQQQEIDKLKRKAQKLIDEEEKRSLRQNQVFQEFKKRTARAHNAVDVKLLDVIDSYEGQLAQLKKEIEYYREKNLHHDFDEGISLHRSDLSGSENYKGLLKSYEKQLKETRKQLKNSEEKKEMLQLEMEGRPQLKDHRLAQQRLKKLEKLLTANNISIPGEKTVKDPYRLKRKYSTQLEDLDYLPVDQCKQHLKTICKEIGVDDISKVISSIQKQQSSSNIGDQDSSRFEKFAMDLHNIVQSLAYVSTSRRQKQSGRRSAGVLLDETLDHDLSIVEQWRNDEYDLPDLQDAINRLSCKVAPWLRIHLTGDLPVSKLISTVDKLAEEEDLDDVKGSEKGPSRKQLESIVSHFQMLFEVSSVSGVYPRMNDVYVKLGEVQNVLHTLRTILGLAEDAKCTAIVDSVCKLCQAHNSTTADQLKRLLQTDDLDSVIRRLEEHSLFFPVFQEVMKKLLDILGLERMDQVIPAVRALKLLAA